MSSGESPSTGETTVFVSYSRVDQAQAIPIIEMIRSAGYSVWWDGMLEAGERYLETTEQALESARVVVVIWSAQSVNSDWVRDEAMSGRDRKCLVPISLDGTMPPLGFRQIQAINFSDWSQRSDSPRSEEVLRAIASLHDAPPAPRPATQLSPRVRSSAPSRRNLLIGGGAAAALAVAGGSLFALRGGNSPAGASIETPGLVVMPFENLSGTTQHNALASALDSEVRKRLTRNSALKVVGRTSSRAVQREGLTAPEICDRLGINFLLEGSLILSDGSLQIATNLVDGRTGLVRWQEEFKGAVDDMLIIQGEIAQAVSANVTNELAQAETKKYGDPTNAAAFQAYLSGRSAFLSAQDDTGLETALGHFDRAISLDPAFAGTHAIKARMYVYWASLSSNIDRANQRRDLAVRSAEDAIALAPDSDDAHSTLGYVNFQARLDVSGAKAPYERSRDLGSGNAIVLTRFAEFAAANGWDQKALLAINRARELDPLNATIFGRLGFVHYLGGRYADARQAFDRAQTLRPSQFHRPSEIGLTHFYGGDADLALSSCESEENGMDRFPCEAIALRALGRTTEADQAAAALEDEYGDAGLYQQAQILAQAGELEACETVLSKAYDLKDTGLIVAKMDPALAPLKGRPRYEELLARMGFEV